MSISAAKMFALCYSLSCNITNQLRSDLYKAFGVDHGPPAMPSSPAPGSRAVAPALPSRHSGAASASSYRQAQVGAALTSASGPLALQASVHLTLHPPRLNITVAAAEDGAASLGLIHRYPASADSLLAEIL